MNEQKTHRPYIISHSETYTLIKCDLCPMSYAVVLNEVAKKEARLDHEDWCCDRMTWIVG